MDDFIKLLPLLNFILLPTFYWILKIEKKITKIEIILGVCKFCPKEKIK